MPISTTPTRDTAHRRCSTAPRCSTSTAQRPRSPTRGTSAPPVQLVDSAPLGERREREAGLTSSSAIVGTSAIVEAGPQFKSLLENPRAADATGDGGYLEPLNSAPVSAPQADVSPAPVSAPDAIPKVGGYLEPLGAASMDSAQVDAIPAPEVGPAPVSAPQADAEVAKHPRVVLRREKPTPDVDLGAHLRRPDVDLRAHLRRVDKVSQPEAVLYGKTKPTDSEHESDGADLGTGSAAGRLPPRQPNLSRSALSRAGSALTSFRVDTASGYGD